MSGPFGVEEMCCFCRESKRDSSTVILTVLHWLPIPVAERSKARVYGHSLAGIAGLNHAGGMDVGVVF